MRSTRIASLLDQHFRSHPHIIDFSNRTFYDGDLRIMTRRPSRNPQSAIRVVQTRGRRDDGSSVNRGEVETVLELISDIAERSKSRSVAPSIGVVSPFRDHVDVIRDRMISDFPATVIERHSLVVGTAHALQGDEKDIVIFTTSIDVDSHPASLRFMETPNLFNVAIMRPRKQLVVVTSLSVEELPSGLFRDFLYHASDHWQFDCQHEARDQETFERALAEKLQDPSVNSWLGYRAAGVRINVVAEANQRYVATLCDGYPVISEELDALTTHRILARAGWPVVRIPHRSWQADWYACVEAILNQLQSRSES